MAATLTKLCEGTTPNGPKFASYTLQAADTEYPSGGYAVSFISQFTTVHAVHIADEADNGLYKGQYDRTNKKVKLIDVAEAGAQVTTSTDVSNLVYYITVTGEE